MPPSAEYLGIWQCASHDLHDAHIVNIEVVGVAGHHINARLGNERGKQVLITQLLAADRATQPQRNLQNEKCRETAEVRQSLSSLSQQHLWLLSPMLPNSCQRLGHTVLNLPCVQPLLHHLLSLQSFP
jgi:hypothetical protein